MFQVALSNVFAATVPKTVPLEKKLFAYRALIQPRYRTCPNRFHTSETCLLRMQIIPRSGMNSLGRKKERERERKGAPWETEDAEKVAMLALVVPEVCFYATVTSATYASACPQKKSACFLST